MKNYSALQSRLHDGARLTRSLDLGKVSETIERALTSAGLDTSSGPMKQVTHTIEQSLARAGLSGGGLNGVGLNGAGLKPARPNGAGLRGAALNASELRAPIDAVPLVREAPGGGARPGVVDRGQFLSRSLTNHAGTRAYKLYVPASYAGEPLPLVVMLHGCTQSPDDFAAGTRMNALAELHGFLVVYPAQASNANCSRCWNWFNSHDQIRDSGEPALIADITREVAANYRVDERRIFVAGLSAGAAMAVILGATYPDLYAAVGAHSGLPYGAARDMSSAFAVMRGGRPLADMADLTGAVPTIVFHGDRDHTVDARNGAEIAERATDAVTASAAGGTGFRTSVEQEVTAHGRTYDRIVHADATGRPAVEHWVLHGAGHAWSGGSPAGSFTDPSGPDASAEMIRFFYSQQRAGTA